MRQKFHIQKNNDKNELKIMEFANLDKEIKNKDFIKVDKEMFSLLCEETYDSEEMKSAIKRGKEDLISTLRTENMFPIGLYADKIAESVINLYNSENNQAFELLFDDREFLWVTNETFVIENDLVEVVEIDKLIK